jgi:hypothetical protein
VLTGVLNVPGGQVVYLLNGSPTFGPVIRAGLAAAGVQAGTPAFDQFLGAAQTVADSGDPINYAAFTAPKKILAQIIVGNGSNNLPDQVVPPLVAGAPLAGGEPLVKFMGLAPIVATTQNASGVRGVVRFTAGTHGSLLDPTSNPAVTAEMQGEMATMQFSNGTLVVVQNTSVIRTQ